MYVIRYRTDIDLLDIDWAGPFSTDAIDAYARELERGFARHGFRPGYRLRMDMRASATQPVAAAAALHARLRDFPRARRIAIVTASAVTRMQVRRLMTQPYLRIFDDAAAAFDWLMDDGRPAAGQPAAASPASIAGVSTCGSSRASLPGAYQR